MRTILNVVEKDQDEKDFTVKRTEFTNAENRTVHAILGVNIDEMYNDGTQLLYTQPRHDTFKDAKANEYKSINEKFDMIDGWLRIYPHARWGITKE